MFIEAQQAFHQAGKIEEALTVLEKLTSCAVTENRYNDAAHYYFLLSRQCSELAQGDKKKYYLEVYFSIFILYQQSTFSSKQSTFHYQSATMRTTSCIDLSKSPSPTFFKKHYFTLHDSFGLDFRPYKSPRQGFQRSTFFMHLPRLPVKWVATKLRATVTTNFKV